jgi:hypothetical protein
VCVLLAGLAGAGSTINGSTGVLMMPTIIKKCLAILAAAGAAAALSFAAAGPAAAYGNADHPLAQVELSANCNNPSFPLCQEVGLGGIWLWVEIDSDGTADVAGAGCGHEPGAGGGAGGIRGEFPWTRFTGSPDAFAAAYPDGLLAGVDPHGSYYVLGVFDFAFPTTVGHYSFRPVPAVTIQLQVAP